MSRPSSSDTAGFGAIVIATDACRGEAAPLRTSGGEPLVCRAARAAVEAGFWPVVVVVGPRADAVRGALAGLPIATVANPEHEAGVAGSIRRGLARLTECAPHALGALFLGCEQFSVRPGHLAALALAMTGSGRPIAAASRAGALGPPVLVARSLFEELLALPHDAGPPALATLDPARVTPVAIAGEEDRDGSERGPPAGGG